MFVFHEVHGLSPIAFRSVTTVVGLGIIDFTGSRDPCDEVVCVHDGLGLRG